MGIDSIFSNLTVSPSHFWEKARVYPANEYGSQKKPWYSLLYKYFYENFYENIYVLEN